MHCNRVASVLLATLLAAACGGRDGLRTGVVTSSPDARTDARPDGGPLDGPRDTALVDARDAAAADVAVAVDAPRPPDAAPSDLRPADVRAPDAAILPPGSTITGLDVAPALVTIGVGTTFRFAATARFSDGTTRDVTTTAAWMSSTPGVATVMSGLARGVSPGMATITATVMGRSATARLTVTSAMLTSLSVDPVEARVPVSARFNFRATGVYGDGTKQDLTEQATWSSSDASVATVGSAGSTAGLVTGVRPGTAVVSASFQGITGRSNVTVTTATLTALEVSPASLTLPVAGAQKFTATALYSDGSKGDVTALAAWESSDRAVLAVSSAAPTQGEAMALAAGTAIVTARLSGAAGTATVTVSSAMLTAIRIAPETASVPRGSSQAFRATGAYSDGTSADVTASVAWSSSDPAVANVSNATGSEGLATGLAAGTATILATLSGVTGMARLTVTDASLTAVTIAPATATVGVGARLQFRATASFSDGSQRDVTEMTAWSVADPSVAGISNAAGTAGQLTGLQVGSTEVSGNYQGRTGAARVTVSNSVLDRITVSPASVNLTTGLRERLTATGVYTDGSSLDITTQVTWSSDDPMVATVSNAAGAQGQVTAVGAGSTTVRARLSDKEGTAQVTVASANLQQLSVSPINPTRRVGDAVQFGASAIFSNGTSQNVTTMSRWSSSNPAVATVNDEQMPRGRATCVSVGTATITATYMGASDTSVLTCAEQPTLQRIQVMPVLATLFVGQQQPFAAVAVFSDGSTQNVTNMSTWVSSDPAVAGVTNLMQRGVVSGLSPGMATITASYMGLSDSSQVTVRERGVLQRISVQPVSTSLRVGQSQQFTATAIYSDGSTANVTGMATWVSSNQAVADVSNGGGGGGPGGGGPGGGGGFGGGGRGTVTAISPGTATITATYMGLSDSGSVTVTGGKLTSISVSPINATIYVGQTVQHQATALFDDGSSQNVTGMAVWASSDMTVADVSTGGFGGPGGGGGSGAVTGIKDGTATITATWMGMSGSTTVTVRSATLTSIQVSPVNATLPVNRTQQYQAIGLYSDGSTRMLTGMATWTSSNEAVARVSNAFGSRGEVTTLAAGMTTIAAVFEGVTGRTSLTVTAATILQIQVTPTNPSIPVNGTQQFQATAVYSDYSTQNVTALATWTSSDPSVAQVSNAGGRGLATGLAAGMTTIGASYMGSSGSTTLTVTSASIREIQVTPTNPTSPVGLTVQFTATAILTDNSTQNVTNMATWTSSDESVATVSNAFGSRGLATALKPGSTVVRATVGGISGQTTYTVSAATLGSITVAPATATVARNATQQFTATGNYSDGTTYSLTNHVTWISTMTSVATISNAAGSRGLATGVSAGNTTIEAHFQGRTGTAQLTVSP